MLTNQDHSKLTFMHTSDEYRKFFTSKTNTRPTFYWLTDRYFDHISCGKYSSWKYFYLFIKNPLLDGIKMRSRHNGYGFDGLYKAYLKFHKYSSYMEKDILTKQSYAEPGIFCSFNKITPDLIAEYSESSNDYYVISPLQYKGLKLDLFHLNSFAKSFLETKLVELFPDIKESIPFISPSNVKGEYIYPNWQTMDDFKEGWWL